MEDHESLNLLDLLIIINNEKLKIYVYRKQTTTNNSIHLTSNHLMEHKIVADRIFIKRIYLLHTIPQWKLQELNEIMEITQNSGYPVSNINS
jgi:hypothetical protein